MGVKFRQAKTQTQMAIEYGICPKTFKKWLKEANIEVKRGLINPKKQNLIYKTFGFPKILEKA
jgi:hypothetical protein